MGLRVSFGTVFVLLLYACQNLAGTAEVPERLKSFHAEFKDAVVGLDDENRLAPTAETYDHAETLDTILPLLTRFCGVVNKKFFGLIREANLLLLNKIIQGNGTNNEADAAGGAAAAEDGETDYGDYGSHKLSTNSLAYSIKKCKNVIGELKYQKDSTGVPISYSLIGMVPEVKVPLKLKKTFFERKKYLNPIVEALWQAFSLSHLACNKEFRKVPGTVEVYIPRFLAMFDPLFKKYWVDEDEYSSLYAEIFPKIDYKREIDKTKACVAAYSQINPDFIVPRRPLLL